MKGQTGTIGYRYHDGGRAAAGFRGTTGDCVVRATAIATKTPYREVYNDLHKMAKSWPGKSRSAARIREKPSPRNGVHTKVIDKYLADRGWKCVRGWTTLDLLPDGNVIAYVRKHIVAVIDHIAYDLYDSTRVEEGYYGGQWVDARVRSASRYWIKT